MLSRQGEGATLVKARPTLSLSGSQGQSSHLTRPVKGTGDLLTWQMRGGTRFITSMLLGLLTCCRPHQWGQLCVTQARCRTYSPECCNSWGAGVVFWSPAGSKRWWGRAPFSHCYQHMTGERWGASFPSLALRTGSRLSLCQLGQHY